MNRITIGFEKGVPFFEIKIVVYHFVEGYFGYPTLIDFCFGEINKQNIYFCGKQVPPINRDNNVPAAQRYAKIEKVDSHPHPKVKFREATHGVFLNPDWVTLTFLKKQHYFC